MAQLDPLVRETLIASVAMTALSGLISLLYWGFTGLSPWRFVVLGCAGGFGFGVALLAISAPKRR